MHIDSAHVPVGQHARQFATLQLFPTSPDRRRSNAQAGDGRTGCYLVDGDIKATRSEEHTSELQSLMRISYAVFCLKKQKNKLSTSYNQHTARHVRSNTQP